MGLWSTYGWELSAIYGGTARLFYHQKNQLFVSNFWLHISQRGAWVFNLLRWSTTSSLKQFDRFHHGCSRFEPSCPAFDQPNSWRSWTRTSRRTIHCCTIWVTIRVLFCTIRRRSWGFWRYWWWNHNLWGIVCWEFNRRRRWCDCWPCEWVQFLWWGVGRRCLKLIVKSLISNLILLITYNTSPP